MNTLKEYPHLFANGKFKIKNRFTGDYDILTVEKLYKTEMDIGIKNYTLIARPIKDMTDGEVISAVNIKSKSYSPEQCESIRKRLIKDAKHDQMWGWWERQLLSIGVYPFDQSHFYEGLVLDRDGFDI